MNISFILILMICWPDFAISESNIEADLVFIVDGSSHTEETLFRQELMLIPSIIDHLPFENNHLRFALITYSKYADLQIGFGFTTNKKALVDKLWSIRKTRNRLASLCFALKLTRKHLFKDYSCCRPRFVVIFSNGDWNLQTTTRHEAQLLREMNVKIFILVLGNNRDRYAAYHLTSSSNIIYRPQITLNYNNNKWINNFIITNIKRVVNEVLTSTVAPTMNLKTNTTSTATIRKSITTTSLLSTKQSGTQNKLVTTIANIQCEMIGHLVFVVDSNDNIGEINFNFQLQFIKNLIQRLKTDKTKLVIALTTYGKEVTIDIPFQLFQNSPDINQTIDRVQYRGGNNGSGSALSLINQNVFANSPNPNIKRIVVLFTGSFSDIGPDPVIISNVMKRNLGVKFLVIEIPSRRWPDAQIANVIFTIKEFKDLNNHLNDIYHTLCQL